MEQFSPLSQQELPIEIIQGQTFTLPITYYDDSGAVINLTSYTAKMQIRVTAEAANPAILELSTVNGLIVITGVQGFIQCTIPAGTAAALTPGLYVYDLFITSPGGVAERLLFGDVKVTRRVTQ